jgi:hypothetical protein
MMLVGKLVLSAESCRRSRRRDDPTPRRHRRDFAQLLANSATAPKTGYAPELLRSCPLTIPPPLPFVSVSIFQSALSPRQSKQFRSEHPHGLPAERPEAVTGGFSGGIYVWGGYGSWLEREREQFTR